MQIQVLSVNTTTKTNTKGKAYQELEVAYKNLTFQGKVEAKKLFDFGAQADSFKALAVAKGADIFEVDVVKNNAGYNDWVKVTKGTGASVQEQPATVRASGTSSAPSKGGWETPEERAKKQIYIVRQSSISAAVNALTVAVKTPPKPAEVIEYARQLEQYVFSTDTVEAVAGKDVGTVEGLEEDLPF